MDSERESVGMRDLLNVLFRYRVRILVVFLAVVLPVTVVTFLKVPEYEAKSTLLVKTGREFRPEVGSGNQTSVSPPNQEEIMNSEIQILINRASIKKVIQAIGVENLYPHLVKTYPEGVAPIDMAVLAFEKDLTVNTVPKSNVIAVSYRHADRRMAPRAVNLLVDSFKEKHLQVFHNPTSSFIDQQLKEYQVKLKGSEDALQQFKQENRVYALDDQRRLLLQQRVNTDSAYREALNNGAELRQRLSILNQKARSMSENSALYTASERDRVVTDAQSKLFDLKMKEQQLLAKYPETNPLVISVKKEIEMARRFAEEQEREAKAAVKTGNPVFQDLEKERIRTEADLRAKQEKSDALRKQLVQMDAEIGKLDLAEKKLLDLRRGFALNEKNYQTYMDKSEEARISDDMNRQKLASISVIQAAAEPATPIKSRKPLNIAFSVIFGGFVAIGFAFFSQHLSQSISSPEEAERRLNLRVLTAVPKERTVQMFRQITSSPGGSAVTTQRQP